MMERKFILNINDYLNEALNNKIISNQFSKWFNNSKVVDNKGNPLVLYHGTNTDFKSFDDVKKGSGNDPGLRGKGFYFTDNIKTSQNYGEVIKKVYLKIENPFYLLSYTLDEITDLLEIDSSLLQERGRETQHHSISVYSPFSGIFSGSIREKGFDGIIHGQEFIVFDPNQIKSIKNDGSWDINDNNIYS